jgi:serine/threonine-protein phosphatase 2A regulatory subunit B'
MGECLLLSLSLSVCACGPQSANVFRSLPPSGDDFDPEEDEPALEPAWPHLQVVYELLLRYTVCPSVKSKVAKRHITQKFCLQLVELFDAEDPRERDYLKTILHRVYGKIMSLRSFIRRAIANVFFRYVYETQQHNGVGELLEILGSIINGFAMPLKPEHVVFLERALIPLHRPSGVGAYHQQLSYCVNQYVEKDPSTVNGIVLGMIKAWPWTNTTKQVRFINELEEILEMVSHEAIDKVFDPLFRVIGKCLGSQHFQVAERCLFLWNSDTLLASGALCRACAPRFLPAIWGDLERAATSHWNPTVSSLAQNVVKHYEDTDPDLAKECAEKAAAQEEAKRVEREERDRKWEELEALVAQASAAAGIRVIDDDTAAGAAKAMAAAVAADK